MARREQRARLGDGGRARRGRLLCGQQRQRRRRGHGCCRGRRQQLGGRDAGRKERAARREAQLAQLEAGLGQRAGLVKRDGVDEARQIHVRRAADRDAVRAAPEAPDGGGGRDS